MASFSFAFSGEDIDDDGGDAPAGPAGAFPIPGSPHRLPPRHHDLAHLLAGLPSKVSYSTLEIRLDNGTVRIPRRELWDVRLQLMAEAASPDDDLLLGAHDVKTGVYEGGFKSWESSADLVAVLSASCPPPSWSFPARIIEVNPSPKPPYHEKLNAHQLGCGTALPSLALFQWAMATTHDHNQPISFILADYNPSVLQLVTLPNLILSWALHHLPSDADAETPPFLRDALSQPGELELTPVLLDRFTAYLAEHDMRLSFLSGAWSPRFLEILYDLPAHPAPRTSLLLGAETIYSPLALQDFRDMLLSVLEREAGIGARASAWVAAKRLYFGVGGSLDDFVAQLRDRGLAVDTVREENDGVRRGVVRCRRPLAPSSD
ncbi:hypothetical protein E4U42_006945 [Claviceps africana]|uniref:Uncharacterized protein n=1 Tax=Claviceps africana TaxID=83212 RepID=A0A8K0J7K6_9HYPO|nr:hypothetical protein E4U42_006945 [Claviceps africana]